MFFYSKHPYYQIFGFPHWFSCLQTPTGWPPIYISLHTTHNTHPTGEMSSVWEDCLSLLPHLQTLVMSPTFDLVTPPGSIICCSSSQNLETIYSYHLLYRVRECHMNCHMKRYLEQDPQGSHVQRFCPWVGVGSASSCWAPLLGLLWWFQYVLMIDEVLNC